MKLKIILTLLVLLACSGTAAGFTVDPATQNIAITYGVTQQFQISNTETCNYNWYVDSVLVSTNTTATDASYTNSSLFVGQHDIELKDDSDLLYAWHVTVSPDLSGCSPATNITTVSIDLDDYSLISTMTTYNESETLYENAERMLGAPIVYGGSDNFAGAWFYAFLMIVTIISIYGKSKSMELTSMITLIMSSSLIVANLSNVTHFPAAFLTFIYISGILALVGVLYSFIGDN